MNTKKLFRVSSIFLFNIALLMGSVLPSVLSNTATAADKVLLDPDVKNVTTGAGYHDEYIDAVNLGDRIRFRIRVNNISGANLSEVKVKAALARMGGSTVGWTMTSESSWPESGNNTGGAIKPISVFTSQNLFLNYIDGSTKISVNGGAIQDVSDRNSTSPPLTFQGYTINDLEAMSIDPQILLYFDVKAESTGNPGLPINIEFDKEMANVTSGSAFSKSVTAGPGDIVRVRIRVHNGCTDGTCSDFPATNVVIRDEFPFLKNSEIVNKAIFDSSEVGPIVSSATLKQTNPQTLEYVKGSTKLVVPVSTDQDLEKLFENGRADGITDIGGISPVLTNEGYKFGTLQFCWSYQRWVVFDVKVKEAPIEQPTPQPKSEVKAAQSKPEVKGVTSLPSTGPISPLVFAGLVMGGLLIKRLRKKI